MNTNKRTFEKEKKWFKPKRYGWGWTPATWQGWLTTLIFMVVVVGNVYRIESTYPESEAFVPLFSQTVFFILVFLYICYKKGTKPKWQWGDKK